jgi:hypothetical protein
MRGAIALTLTGLLLTFAAWGALPVAAEQGPDFRWEVPSSYAGSLVVRLSWEPTAPSWCWFSFGAVGSADPQSPVLLWMQESGGGGGSFSSGHTAQLHAEGFEVDTRELAGGGGAWGAAFGFGTNIVGAQTWTLAANLDWWPQSLTGDAAAFIEIDCEDADVTVGGFAGSDQLVTFREDSMQGTGASADAIFAGASLQLEDRAGGTFSTQSVLTDLLLWSIPGTQVGSLTMSSPSGEKEYDLSGTSMLRVTAGGGPGEYQTTITRAAAGQLDLLIGVYAGLDPVDDLDDLL